VDFVKYRKYTVVIDNGKKFYDILAKNKKMCYKPFALKPKEFQF